MLINCTYTSIFSTALKSCIPFTIEIKLVDQYSELSETSSHIDAPGFVLGTSLTEWDPCRLWNPGIGEVWIGNVNLCPGLAWGHIFMGCSSEGSLKGRLQQNCQEIANKNISQPIYLFHQ